MKNPNYQTMSDEELRDWVRYHPEDVEAFHTLMDRLELRPKILCTTDEEIEAELRKRINQKSQ
jgi:hypothetical protein